MTDQLYCEYQSPIGPLLLVQAEQEGRTGLSQVTCHPQADWGLARPGDSPLLTQAQRQLEEYFAGQRRCFDLPLLERGTAFQLAAWQALRRIPYGQTRSYSQIAAAIGRPRACRAVGQANHNNPLLIITPCHRVVGANGSLTGFGGGLEMKRFLLELEGKTASATLLASER